MNTLRIRALGIMILAFWRYRMILILCFALLACVACSADTTQLTATDEPAHVGAASELSEAQPSLSVEQTLPATPTAEVHSSTPSVQPLAIATEESTVTPAPGSAELSGPLALLVSESAQQPYFSASIFDPGTANIQKFNFQDDRPFAAQWLGDGCELYLNGDVYDLDGNIVWQTPSPLKARLGSFYTDRLSPYKNWLASPIFSGPETYDSSEFVDVETTSLLPPFPSYRLTQRGGAESGAFVWSPDEEWLYYSDYDADGTLQIFRATPDGQIQEQLTNHQGVLGTVNSMAISPDGQYLAYGIKNLLFTKAPYQYAEADEGWVGLINVGGGSISQIRLPMFSGVFDEGGLWWSATGGELLIFGSSLPISITDPLQGDQIHWIRVDEGGMPFRSVYDSEVPGGSIGWMMPVASDLSTIFVQTPKGYFWLEEGGFSPYQWMESLEEVTSGSRIIAFIPGPASFHGGAECQR